MNPDNNVDVCGLVHACICVKVLLECVVTRDNLLLQLWFEDGLPQL